MRNSEYYNLLKEKIGQIKDKHQDIVDLTDSLDCRQSYKNLFTVFLSNLKNAGVSDEIYKKTEQMLIQKSNVKRTEEEHECYFGASSEEREVCTFDKMLCKCAEKKGVKFYEDALNYSISQFNSNKEKGNIIDHFLSYAVASNYDDIEYGTWDDAHFAEDYYESTIYGYPLGRMTLEKMPIEDGKEVFSPESLHIRKNLQGLRLGAFLLRKLMKDMSEQNPGEPLVSPTVMMSNVNALKLYTRLGADIYVDEKKVEDPINGMDHSINENCLVVFSPEAIKKNAEMIIEKPTEKINKIEHFNEGLEL